MNEGFYQRNGNWWIDKDPGDKLLYGIDLADELAFSQTTISTVNVSVYGLDMLGLPILSGSIASIMLGGMDLTDQATNAVTFIFTLSSGEVLNRSINFRLRYK
jgi:hypothetical protein